MQLRRMLPFLAAVALAGVLVAPTALASDRDKDPEDIWKDEPRQPRSWWNRELSDETIKRVMDGLRKRDPAKAKELEQLRKKDRDLFDIQLHQYGRPEFEQMGREYWESRRRKRHAEFLEWLKANYVKEHEDLIQLEDRDPTLYARNFEHLMKQYGYIFDADKSNPELGTVLKEDYALKQRRDELRHRIRRERSESQREKFGLELQQIVARRYDLIVRQKEIAYERLLGKLEDLQRQIQESRDEIAKWKDDDLRRENVRQRVKSLTRGKVTFRWD